MFYGLLAVWLVLCAYVVSLATRERRIRRELELLNLMVEEREHSAGRSCVVLAP